MILKEGYPLGNGLFEKLNGMSQLPFDYKSGIDTKFTMKYGNRTLVESILENEDLVLNMIIDTCYSKWNSLVNIYLPIKVGLTIDEMGDTSTVVETLTGNSTDTLTITDVDNNSVTGYNDNDYVDNTKDSKTTDSNTTGDKTQTKTTVRTGRTGYKENLSDYLDILEHLDLQNIIFSDILDLITLCIYE